MDRADHALREVGQQIRGARRLGGLSIRAAAGSVGVHHSTFGRIERHQLRNVTARQLALACAAVGLDLGIRTFLAGDPVRDAPQLRLLARFHARLPPRSPWAVEVPMPVPGDLRALDGWTRLEDTAIGVEAETRLSDLQAVARKAMLKKRDARLDRIVLLIAESRANRAVLTLHREDLRATFPLDTRPVMAALSQGRPPAADGIVVL
jgi:transcriptional regulator with XRE-family HTH domain